MLYVILVRAIRRIDRLVSPIVGSIGILPTVVLLAACAPADDADITLHIESLTQLSTKALRERRYGATITIEQAVALAPLNSYLASYLSDGLRVYARIDTPDSPQPDQGYPVVIFVHGWAGIEQAPTYDLYFRNHVDYSEMVENYVDAGFVVLTPGWRGHGTINDIPADGIEFMQAWDNGSYISPVFYAIDVLNLVDSLSTFDKAKLDLARDISLSIYTSSHLPPDGINAGSIHVG